MDPFKKYLQENREALDSDTPRPLVWDRIEKELPTPAKTISISRIVAWSAAACVLVLAGIGITRFARNEIRDTSSGLREIASNAKPKTSRHPELVEGSKPVTRIPKLVTRNPKPVSRIPYPETRISELESSFTQVINLQKARISTIPMYAESAAYFNDFAVQLKQMEKDEQLIKYDIRKKGMNNELLDQLINIYQQKLNMLKQLQLEMQKTNNRYKQNRASVDTVRTYFLSI